jgi:hypothetical protein
MRDAGKLVGGLVIVAAVLAGPFWFGWARGEKPVTLPKANADETCVEPTPAIRKNHPALLASWRDRVVRQGDRVHEKADGRAVRISLTDTCLGCHGNATQFCDSCHAQSGVTLSCWQCHKQEKN